MPDPLSSISDPVLKSQLQGLREKEGEVLTADNLRKELQGFRGQKGIYKPSGSPYALWVRQTLRGAYPDQKPVFLPDGSWTYRYAPEGREGKTDMSLDTNRALLRCKDAGVPIGVLVQREGDRGRRTYEVLGLAFVEAFDGVHFVLRGEPIDVESSPVPGDVPPPFEPFDKLLRPKTEILRILREQRFKYAVRQIYHERCSLCELGFKLRGMPLGLEAAHVIPFEDGGTSRDVRNGILLCRNHHSLFDSSAWTFDQKYRVVITEDREFRSSAVPNHILKLEGETLPNLPDRPEDCPDPKAIEFRLGRFSKAWE